MTDKDDLKFIADKIIQRKVVLFLGAGTSKLSGAPTGTELGESIKKNFTKINQTEKDFFEICENVIESTYYSRSDLENFIKEKLYKLQPSESHYALVKYDWRAIFTTNFDDLIETAYRNKVHEISKKCCPIYNDHIEVSPSDYRSVYLFKLMGSINASTEETGQMVLSRGDNNRAIRIRGEYAEVFSDFLKDGNILFIGYSFGDRKVFDFFDEVLERKSFDKLQPSFALFKEIDRGNEEFINKLRKRKITPVECSFEHFFEFLDENYKREAIQETNKIIYYKLRDELIGVEKNKLNNYFEYFESLDEDKIVEAEGSIDDFFKNVNKKWGAFRLNWDYKREIYLKTEKSLLAIKDRILNEMKISNIKENKIILIKGMAGSGKTSTLKRLAYDIYVSGSGPVIIIDGEKIKYDYKVLSGFVEDLNREYNKKLQLGEHRPPLKILIIIDNAAGQEKQIERILHFLTSVSRPTVLVISDRTNEWNVNEADFVTRGGINLQIPQQNIYELSEKLTENEIEGIINHFSNLKYINKTERNWKDFIEKECENSYFASIYSLVDPSKKPLDEIIKNQYNELSGLAKQAFINICSFHQYNLPINQDLLVRTLKCTYDELLNTIKTTASKIIFEEVDYNGFILYKSHHRIIASKTMDFYFSDKEQQKNIFLNIFENVVMQNIMDRELCERLLVFHIGPNAKEGKFTYDQQRQLFSCICKKHPSRSLIHHWGILEEKDGKLSKAEELFRKALSLPKNDMESHRDESDSNILTSLGRLYSNVAIQMLQKKLDKEAEVEFAKAEKAFNEAKLDIFQTPHAYHCQAHMNFNRGKLVVDQLEKIKYFAEALKIISYAKDNFNEEQLQFFYELETKIWTNIGDESKIKEMIELIKQKYNSSIGYFLYANYIVEKFLDPSTKSKMDDNKKLVEALEIVNEGLKSNNLDENCLRLKAKLIKELEPTDFNGYYETLNKWLIATKTYNSFLLYELARVSFILGYYDNSKDHFFKLESGIGKWKRNRLTLRDPILDEKGKMKEFQGKVVFVSPDVIEGKIKAESLRSLNYSINFRANSLNFTPTKGMQVSFGINFNNNGPRAFNINKI